MGHATRKNGQSSLSKRVIGYIRVSTNEQASSGLSLESQEAKIRGYAGLYDLDLVDVVVDPGVSAATLDRPGLTRVLDMLGSGAVVGVVVAKLDRLTRSVVDLGTLIADYFENAALFSVAENIDTRSAAGRLVLNVLASVAQWEREAIGERTSAALQAKRARGERAGTVPYGFRATPTGKLKECPREQRVIALVRRLRKEGETFRSIVTELHDRGIVGRTGNPLGVRQVHTIAQHAAGS